MTKTGNQNQSKNRSINKRKTLLISLGILVLAVIATAIIFSTEPEATREGATKKTAMLVEVVSVEKGDFYPDIVTTGVVIPEQDIILSPRISGEVIKLSSDYTPGGFVSKGEVLLQIDPADYRNTLDLRKSELKSVLADLDMEMGRQHVAQQDYQMVQDSLSDKNKSLVLREPQLNAIKADVEAARTAVHRAELDLLRTTIRAPFDAHIIERNVNTGSQVAPGETLGRLVGIDTYWIEATVPLAKINWLSFPGNEGELGSEVKIRSRTGWKENEFRTGHLHKLIGALENQTRLARILIAVHDPLVRKESTGDLPPLMIGAFVETHLKGNMIENVVRLNRDYMRQNETVWVMEDGQLSIRNVKTVMYDPSFVYIDSGLDAADKVVATNLSTVVDGEALRVATETAENRDSTIAAGSDRPYKQ